MCSVFILDFDLDSYFLYDFDRDSDFSAFFLSFTVGGLINMYVRAYTIPIFPLYRSAFY